MKAQLRWIILLIPIALGTVGCSHPGVLYWGHKAYAKNPETGKWISWEHKESQGRVYRTFRGESMHWVPMCWGTGFGGNIMSGYSPKIDCSSLNIPCSIK